jgi:predicted metal-dependent hydrolase
VLDPGYIEGAPEESHATTAFSLLLPYLDPYLIRTMKEAKKQITDPDRVQDLERFCAQEGQHYRQHKRFNDVIRSVGFPAATGVRGRARGGLPALQRYEVAALRPGLRRGLRGLLPRVLPTYLPWYTPAKIEFTEEMRALANRHSEMAIRLS